MKLATVFLSEFGRLPAKMTVAIWQLVNASVLAVAPGFFNNRPMGFFGKKSHDLIEVQFFDLATHKMFAQSKMPIGRLPESFEASTTLHLANEDWSVVEARPVTVAEFGRTGKLTLILSKIIKGFIDSSTILFSMPTIANDALPSVAAGTSKLGVEIIEIHEDDWRQVEWLPALAEKVIESELNLINGILGERSEGRGVHEMPPA